MEEQTTKGDRNNDHGEKKGEGSSASSIDNERAISAIAYLVFFLPLLTNKDSEFAMFHANQGLNLFLTAVAVNVVGWAIPFLGWFIILPLGSIFVLILLILGIVNALNGKQKELPLIGKFRFLNGDNK